MKIQLLTVTESPTEFVLDPAWCAQEKLNGERLLIQKTGKEVRAFNRLGVERSIPAPVLAKALASRADWVIDGELVGDRFTAFDILSLNGGDLVHTPMISRFYRASRVAAFQTVRIAIGEEAKRQLLESIENEKGEGVVFKKMDEPHRDGRDSNAVKFKFWNSESFVVRSVDIASGTVTLQRDGKECGKCQFPFKGTWPKAGEVVEIRFQSRGKTGKCIHPSLLGIRTDIHACEIA